MTITAIKRHIGAAIGHWLVKTPGRGLVCGERLLIDPAHVGVTKAPVEGDRRLDIAHVDADVGHAHDLCLLGVLGGPQNGALLQLEIDPVGVAHEHKTITRSTIRLADKRDALAFKQRVIRHQIAGHQSGVGHTQMIGFAIGRLRVERHVPLQQIYTGGVLCPGKQQHLAFLQLILTEIEHAQRTRHRVGIGEREPRDALSKAKAPIELTGTVEVLGVNRKMKARPEADIGARFESNFGRLDRRL